MTNNNDIVIKEFAAARRWFRLWLNKSQPVGDLVVRLGFADGSGYEFPRLQNVRFDYVSRTLHADDPVKCKLPAGVRVVNLDIVAFVDNEPFGLFRLLKFPSRVLPYCVELPFITTGEPVRISWHPAGIWTLPHDFSLESADDDSTNPIPYALD